MTKPASVLLKIKLIVCRRISKGLKYMKCMKIARKRGRNQGILLKTSSRKDTDLITVLNKGFLRK